MVEFHNILEDLYKLSVTAAFAAYFWRVVNKISLCSELVPETAIGGGS